MTNVWRINKEGQREQIEVKENDIWKDGKIWMLKTPYGISNFKTKKDARKWVRTFGPVQNTRAVQNTAEVINRFRGNEHEFYILKGILCVSLDFDWQEKQTFDSLINTNLVASRMDDIRMGK